jgi:hypothetical protein
MKKTDRPLPLTNAPLQYAPKGEMGVVFLFAKIAKQLQFRVEEIRAAFPDCIAYRYVGNSEKRVRIEFEFKSSSFKTHRHNPAHCDCIVCWHHDWPTAPRHIEVIELKRFFGVPFKVWIQVAIKDQQDQLDKRNRLDWALSTRVTHGDLLLMYRGYPSCKIADIFRFVEVRLKRGQAGWRDGEANFGRIERVCKLESPIFLEDMRNHRILRTASFIRQNMQGRGHLVSEYWPYIYSMLRERNPKVRPLLEKFAPEKLY